jgi:uncharacterized membrane protein YhaH (DUF805 family)
MIEAVWLNFYNTVTRHYFDMRGRVGRAQFWWFVLAGLVLSLLASILEGLVWLPLRALFHLAMILPWAGMGARRLQDTGRDGRLVWLFFILVAATQIVGVVTALAFVATGFLGWLFAPGLWIAGSACLVMGIVLLVFWAQPGDPQTNLYGPPPPVFDPASRPVSPPP